MKPTQVMITLKLHQVNFAHLAVHIVVGEILIGSGAIALPKPISAEALRGAVGAPLRDNGHLASLSLVVCFFLLPSHN